LDFGTAVEINKHETSKVENVKYLDVVLGYNLSVK